MSDPTRIRNFCIIAHIDHGKSTLADRLLELTGAITPRERREQLLDDMDLERERGITIKASAVRLTHAGPSGQPYILNLIDTPGHVDFSFEVAKSIQACEGAVLLVDAAQGVEAQTVANYYLAREHHLRIIPALNKIDLPNAEPARVAEELSQLADVTEEQMLLLSAKDGDGIEQLVARIIADVPAPTGRDDVPLQALVFDSSYDAYKGVIVYLRIMNGQITPNTSVRFMGTGRVYLVQEVGVFTPRAVAVPRLTVGEVGYITCNIRTPRDVVAGDTVTQADAGATQALPGFHAVKPNVFAGLYPTNPGGFVELRASLERLALNDAAFTYEPEQSEALGPGFRCGFLGLLHLDIVQERLEREYNVSLVTTSPSVVHEVTLQNGAVREIHSSSALPAPHEIRQIAEPIVTVYLLIPSASVGAMMELCTSRRGTYRSTDYLSAERVKLTFEMPLAELIVDFYDKLKSATRGYGSLDYEWKGFAPAKLVKLDVLINNVCCEPLASIVPHDQSYARGRALVDRLKTLIPRQLFEVVLQAAVGSHIIARESIRPVGKNVTGKCYGGDITRKRKLWEKQKKGKKRMKQFGQVEIPQEAFLSILRRD